MWDRVQPGVHFTASMPPTNMFPAATIAFTLPFLHSVLPPSTTQIAALEVGFWLMTFGL